MERLLKEYRENQELVRRIGSHSYQIIYPVQLRHHEKMGISTREVSKVRTRRSIRKRNTYDSGVCQKCCQFHFIFSYFSFPPPHSGTDVFSFGFIGIIFFRFFNFEFWFYGLFPQLFRLYHELKQKSRQ